MPSASISTVVPVFSPAVQSRMRRRPVTMTRSPFLIDVDALMASWRNAVTENQLVSP
jgi:hypothetical protein